MVMVREIILDQRTLIVVDILSGQAVARMVGEASMEPKIFGLSFSNANDTNNSVSALGINVSAVIYLSTINSTYSQSSLLKLLSKHYSSVVCYSTSYSNSCVPSFNYYSGSQSFTKSSPKLYEKMETKVQERCLRGNLAFQNTCK